MICMIVSLGIMGDKEVTPVKAGTFLTVDMSEISGDRDGSNLFASFKSEKSVGLIDAVNAIRAAASDDKVKGLLLKGEDGLSVSWGSLTELRDAIAEFKGSEKPVVAYATSYSQGQYYAVSLADKVCMHPSGMVDFRGMGAEVMYYKDLLDKLGVEMQLIRPESCSYKSAGEVYTLNHMSAANREQIRAYIGSVWRTATAGFISSAKGHSSMISVADAKKISLR